MAPKAQLALDDIGVFCNCHPIIHETVGAKSSLPRNILKQMSANWPFVESVTP
jgi:hypothetical protein